MNAFTINGRGIGPIGTTPKTDTAITDREARDQATSLLALAAELDESNYLGQLQVIDHPHAVLNALVEMMVGTVPSDMLPVFARAMRATLNR